ncbi:uncharacterized protein LOC116263154 [Nymphaea colorata]|nr:uncharacterized protein LOC116263154 [Nymphaea colorata]
MGRSSMCRCSRRSSMCRCSSSSSSSTTSRKLMALAFTVLAMLSPLYIDRKPAIRLEDEESSPRWLMPFLLMGLIMAISFTRSLDRRFAKFDPYWIHRIGGSSCGIISLLVMLALVLKCKTSLSN